ncbi:hypothetical protein QZH41_006297 [Actinostola sp. cb2023]|nr:hypothetical protein QZH41_006297 [Actinostola sp. cb2023]
MPIAMAYQLTLINNFAMATKLRDEGDYVSVSILIKISESSVFRMVIGVFAVAYIPSFVCSTVEAKLGSGTIPAEVFRFFTVVVFLNSALNAVIYSIRSEEYRREIKRFIKDVTSKICPSIAESQRNTRSHVRPAFERKNVSSLTSRTQAPSRQGTVTTRHRYDKAPSRQGTVTTRHRYDKAPSRQGTVTTRHRYDKAPLRQGTVTTHDDTSRRLSFHNHTKTALMEPNIKCVQVKRDERVLERGLIVHQNKMASDGLIHSHRELKVKEKDPKKSYSWKKIDTKSDFKSNSNNNSQQEYDTSKQSTSNFALDRSEDDLIK